MSFPRYPKYKPSGVEWLGDVPTDWAALPLKRLTSVPITDGPHETPAFVDDGVPFVSVEAVSNGALDFSKIRGYISRYDHERYSAKYAPLRDDIYMVKSGATTGVTAIVETDAVFDIWSPLAAIRCNEALYPKFLLYYMRSRNFLDGVTLGWSFGTQQNIGMNVIENLACALPPRREQLAIAAFLDRETGKIDALVGEQERLVALLKEKRQALISHAVTKGLNPDAPMKPSGIDWLGDVSAHWSVLPLKRDIRFLTSGSRGWAEHCSAQGELFIRIGNLTRDRVDLDLSDIQRVSVESGTEGERTKVAAGDILFSITAYLGSVAIVPSDLEPAYVSQHVALVRLARARLVPRWVGYVTLSSIGKTCLDMQAYGGTKIQLSLDDVANAPITSPPLGEQLRIIDWLDIATSRIDALVAEATHAIALLKERRTTLISAAVTGKIDVRALG